MQIDNSGSAAFNGTVQFNSTVKCVSSGVTAIEVGKSGSAESRIDFITTYSGNTGAPNKIRLWGNLYGLGVSGQTLDYFSFQKHNWVTTTTGTSQTVRMTLDNSNLSVVGNVSAEDFNPTGKFQNAVADEGTVATDQTYTVTTNVISVTLGASVTLNFNAGSDGQQFILRIREDGSGSRTLALGTNCAFGSNPSDLSAMNTSANSVTYVYFIYDNSKSKWQVTNMRTGF